MNKKIFIIIFLFFNFFITSCSNPKESDLKIINKKYYLNDKDEPFSGEVEIDERHNAFFEKGTLIKIISNEDEDINYDNENEKELSQAVSQRYLVKREDKLYYLVTSDIPFSGKTKVANTYSANYKDGKLLNYNFKNKLSYEPENNFLDKSIKLSDVEKLELEIKNFDNTSSNSFLGFDISIEIKSEYTYKVYHDLDEKGSVLKNPRQSPEIFKSSNSFFKKYKKMEPKDKTKDTTKWGYTKITKPQHKIFHDRDKYGSLETEYYDRKTGSYKPKEGPETFESLQALKNEYPRIKLVSTSRYGKEDRWGMDGLWGYFEIQGTYLFTPGKTEFIYKGTLNRTKTYSEVWEGSYLTKNEDRFIEKYNDSLENYNKHGQWKRYSIMNGQKKLLEERYYEYGDLISSSVVENSSVVEKISIKSNKNKSTSEKKKKVESLQEKKKDIPPKKIEESVLKFDNKNERHLLIQFINAYYNLDYTPSVSDNELSNKIIGFFNGNSKKSSNASGWDKYRKNKKRNASGISADRMKKIKDNLKKDNWNYIIESNIYRTKKGQELWMDLALPYIEKD